MRSCEGRPAQRRQSVLRMSSRLYVCGTAALPPLGRPDSLIELADSPSTAHLTSQFEVVYTTGRALRQTQARQTPATVNGTSKIERTSGWQRQVWALDLDSNPMLTRKSTNAAESAATSSHMIESSKSVVAQRFRRSDIIDPLRSQTPRLCICGIGLRPMPHVAEF